GKGLAAERLLNERRVDIGDPIAESRGAAGGPVMRLVRMKHVALAGEAAPQLASVAESLDARYGDADRIGVVAVRRKRLADEPRLETLDPHASAADPDAVSGAGTVMDQAL